MNQQMGNAHRIGNTVAETDAFSRAAKALWSETELDVLKDYVACNPRAGDEIQGTGGLRKLRWSRAGMGKRGGARVIYYFYDDCAPIYLLWAYPKNQQDDLSAEMKAVLTKSVTQLKSLLRTQRRTQS